MARVNWSLFLRTVMAVAGLLLLLGGLTDLGLVLRGEAGGRTTVGLLSVLAGGLLLGWPVVTGVREAIAAKRRGET